MTEDMKIIDESQDRKYFTILPNFILNHSTANDQALYAQMKRAAGENGLCFMTQETFCKKLGIGKIKLQKALKYLLYHKWITFAGTTPGKTKPINTYKVNDIWKLNTEYYQEQKISSESAESPDSKKEKFQIRPKKSPRTAYIRRTNVKEEPINTAEAKASVIKRNVDNSGDNRTPNGNCSGCTDPDPLGGTHSEGTYQHPFPERRNTISSIGEILKRLKSKPDAPQKGRTKYPWQDEAIRIWHEIGLRGSPTGSFFKLFKLAYKKGEQGKLSTCLSYCKDAEGIKDMEKLFYWRFANEPGRASAKTNDL